MTQLTTTLNDIRKCSPCESGWKILLKHLDKTEADDEPLLFSVIVESNGLTYALWCTRAAPEYDKEWRLFAVWCARQVQHIMVDVRSIAAIDVAERFAHGRATDEERAAARDAASDAAWAVARDAASVARAACAAASVAAWDAAWDAASDAACAASAATAAQKTEFLRVVSGALK